MQFRRHLQSLLPQAEDVREVRHHWKTDILAGITTGIVALPLALAFGVASGVGATAGLMTAIVAGIVAAIFGGSRFQISGPTGAMVVILAPLVAEYGTDVVPLLSILAAFLLMGGALLGFGRIISLIPWPVIEGFTLGIAFTLFFQQIPNALGVEAPVGGNSLATGIQAIADADYPAALIPLGVALGTAVLIVLFDRIHPQFPGSLVALVVATLAVMWGNLDVPQIGEIPDSLPAPALPHATWEIVVALIPGAISVAILAGIESLLSARVAAGMVPGGTYNPDRELVGQGAANFAAGLVGGMPATGAIVRTAVNIRAGGRSRLSPVVHSLLLVAIVYMASDVVGIVPLSALAGVLFVTSFRMIPFDAIRQIMRSTRTDAAIFVLTVLITVAFDLIWAIIIGVIIAATTMMRYFANLSGVKQEYPVDDPRIRVLRIDGAMFFGVSDRIEEKITSLEAVRVVIIRMSRVGVMDATGAKALSDIVTTLRRADNHVLIVGMRATHEALTETLGLTATIGGEDRFFDTMNEALDAAAALIECEDAERRERRRARDARRAQKAAEKALVQSTQAGHESDAGKPAPSALAQRIAGVSHRIKTRLQK